MKNQSSLLVAFLELDLSCFSLLTTAKSETNDSSIQTRAATTSLQSEADILSQPGGDTKLQGAQVKAQTFTVNAGVGSSADPEAKVIIEHVKETLQTSHTEKSESVLWHAQSGNGVTEETLKLAQINAKTKWLTQVKQPTNWSANNASPSVPSVIRVDLNSVTQISAPIKERLK